jgi:hypothetical protein
MKVFVSKNFDYQVTCNKSQVFEKKFYNRQILYPVAHLSNLRIELKETNFSLRKTVLSHGWVNLPPYKYDYENNILNRTEFVNSNLVQLFISQKNNYVKVKVKSKAGVDPLDPVAVPIKTFSNTFTGKRLIVTDN